MWRWRYLPVKLAGNLKRPLGSQIGIETSEFTVLTASESHFRRCFCFFPSSTISERLPTDYRDGLKTGPQVARNFSDKLGQKWKATAGAKFTKPFLVHPCSSGPPSPPIIESISPFRTRTIWARAKEKKERQKGLFFFFLTSHTGRQKAKMSRTKNVLKAPNIQLVSSISK